MTQLCYLNVSDEEREVCEEQEVERSRVRGLTAVVLEADLQYHHSHWIPGPPDRTSRPTPVPLANPSLTQLNSAQKHTHTLSSVIYRGRTRTQTHPKNLSTMSLSSFFSSFFETSAVHCDAPEPKEEEVKEKETASEEAEEEEEEEPEDVSLLLRFWVLVEVWSW